MGQVIVVDDLATSQSKYMENVRLQFQSYYIIKLPYLSDHHNIIFACQCNKFRVPLLDTLDALQVSQSNEIPLHDQRNSTPNGKRIEP